jgi:hypothetical protein
VNCKPPAPGHAFRLYVSRSGRRARQRQDLSRYSAASSIAHILAEGDRTAWLGREDSNSRMSLPLAL